MYYNDYTQSKLANLQNKNLSHKSCFTKPLPLVKNVVSKHNLSNLQFKSLNLYAHFIELFILIHVLMAFLIITNTNINIIYLSSVPLGISFEANRQSLVVSFTTNFCITQLLNLVELSFTEKSFYRQRIPVSSCAKKLLTQTSS